jgi:L-ascorbate metabolism protein UlaG (beta-lactamase superfamily)
VDTVTYVGHATTLVELGGARLLTDPVLRSRVGYIRRIAAPPAPEVCERLDAVLISHAHHDHLDTASLRRLPGDVPVIAPRGCRRFLRRRAVTEVGPGDRVRVGAVDVLAVPAEHDGRRMPIGAPSPAVGYVIGGRVVFFGDTDVFEGMRELAGELEVALLPIWGWGSKLGPGHMDPGRAARAAALLRPRVAVPIHWGTLARARVWWRADPALPARRFTDLVADRAPDVAVRVLAPGGRLELTPPAGPA